MRYAGRTCFACLNISEEIHIGNNVWLACNVVVLAGVHIGDNTVIGAGSVVTKDVPADFLAFGNPCKPVRLDLSEIEGFAGWMLL